MNKTQNEKGFFTDRLISIVAKNPGLDGIGLKGKGFRPSTHGSLRAAELAGLVEFRNGGWHVRPQ